MELTTLEKAFLALFSFALMMGIGATLSLKDFKPALKKPKALIIGFLSQYGWMPLIAFCLSKAFSLPNEYAIGLILVGSIPGGASSNFLTYWAKGDTALSISMTIASTLSSIIILPVLLILYTSPFTSTELVMPYKNIILSLSFVLFPVFVGMWAKAKNEKLASILAQLGNIFGVLIIIAMMIIWVPKFIGQVFETKITYLIPTVMMAYVGFILGYLSSYLLKLPSSQRRAISLETGMQNAPIAFAIILLSFPSGQAEKIMWLPILYGTLGMLNGLVAALFFRMFKS